VSIAPSQIAGAPGAELDAGGTSGPNPPAVSEAVAFQSADVSLDTHGRNIPLPMCSCMDAPRGLHPLRVRDAAGRKGTSATVLIGKGMQHDWPLTLPWLDESRLAWNAMRTFVEEH
jgi:hypothetical protein